MRVPQRIQPVTNQPTILNILFDFNVYSQYSPFQTKKLVYCQKLTLSLDRLHNSDLISENKQFYNYHTNLILVQVLIAGTIQYS